jgi:hypothetical protein
MHSTPAPVWTLLNVVFLGTSQKGKEADEAEFGTKNGRMLSRSLLGAALLVDAVVSHGFMTVPK